MSIDKNRLPKPVIRAMLIYTFTAMTVVFSAWAAGIHRFDLSLTISKYIALRQGTYYMYIAAAVAMMVLVVPYVIKLQAEKARKAVYLLVLACVLGCALFPYNTSWSMTTSRIHDLFAYLLFLGVTVSFIMMLIKPKDAVQKRFASISAIYALTFIVLYAFLKFRLFHATILIWENVLIYLLMCEMLTE